MKDFTSIWFHSVVSQICEVLKSRKIESAVNNNIRRNGMVLIWSACTLPSAFYVFEKLTYMTISH